MNKKWIYWVLVPLAVYALWSWLVDFSIFDRSRNENIESSILDKSRNESIDSSVLDLDKSGNESLDFAILDKSGNESIVLRIPESSVDKYPGWKYVRNGPVSFKVWYPSLTDKVSINYWISSSSDIKASKEKPTDNDHELSITIGRERMKSPKNTLDFANRPVDCDLSRATGQPYVEEGIVDGFRKYVSYDFVVSSKNATPTRRAYYKKYLPNKPIEGVYCLKCVVKANCRIYGITESGIPYSAVYDEEKMPKEAMEIHKAVGQYLSSKIVD